MREFMTSGAGRLLLAGVVLAAGANGAQAQTPAESLLNNPFVFNLGGYIVTTDVKAHLNGSSSTNPDVDFDHTFGKDTNATRIRADALWRIAPRHHLRFMYFDNTSDRNRVIDEDIHWGDYTFHAGADVDSRTKFTIFELAYEYAFMKAPAYEINGSVGVHYMKFSQQLSGTATFTDANGVVSAATFTSKDASVPVPLPVIGVRAAWAFAPQWVLEGQGQVFKADIGDYSGHVTDLRAGVTWMFNKNFGAGLGYNRFWTTVDTTKSNFNGSLRLGYSGAQLFVTGSF
jgi:hypothetical protein